MEKELKSKIKIKPIRYLKNEVTVDPGWNTGLALWTGDIFPITFLLKEPNKHKSLKDEIKRLLYMQEKFSAYINSVKPKRVTIEGVELWTGSIKSMASSSRGDTFTLAYLVGAYLEICRKKIIPVKLVYPRGDKKKNKEAWKGQLSKNILTKRIYRINGRVYPEHVREAVGIGFHEMGIL